MSETPHNLSEELYFQNNTATLFHRTRLKIEDVDKILKNGWSDSGSGHYGRGIYTTYKIEDQFDGVKDSYGLILLKFKYTALDKLLCFTPAVAKKVHPEGYTLKQQLEKLWPEHKSIDGIDAMIKRAQEMVDEGGSSAAAARFLYTRNIDLNENVYGIEYIGDTDGHCVCIYPPAENLILLAALQTTSNQSLPDDPQWLTVSAAKKLWSKAFPSGLYTDLGVGTSLSVSKGFTKSKIESLKVFFEKKVIRQRDVDDLIKDIGPADAFNFVKKVPPSKVFGSANGLYLGVLFVPFANKMSFEKLMEYVLNENTRSVEEKLTFIKSVQNEILDTSRIKYTDSLYKTYMTFIKSNNLVQNQSVEASAFLNTTLRTLSNSKIMLSGDMCNDLIDTFGPRFNQPINRSSATVQDQVSALIFYRCELSKLHELIFKLSNVVININDILISIEKKYEYYGPATSSSDIQTRFFTVIDIFDGPRKDTLPVEFFDKLLSQNNVASGFNRIIYTYLLQDKKAPLTTVQIHMLSRFVGLLITSEQYLDMALKTLDTETPLTITPDLLNGVLSGLESKDDEKSWDDYVKLITTVTSSTNPVEFTVKHPLSANSFLQFVRSLNRFNVLDGKNLFSVCSIGIESAYGKRDAFLKLVFPNLVSMNKIDSLITFRNLFFRALVSSDPGPVYTLLKDLHALKPSVFNVLKTDPTHLGELIKGTYNDRLGKYNVDYSSGLYVVKYSLILEIINVDDIPASVLYDIIKNSSKYDYISLLELCSASDNLLSQQFGYAREIIGLLVNSDLFSNKVYDRIRNLDPSAFTTLTPERVLTMFGNRSDSTFYDPPHNPKATSSYLDILKTIKNNKSLVEELNKNSIYADAIIKFFQTGVRIADQNARDYLQYLVHFLTIFKTSLNSKQTSTLISIISYPAIPSKRLWVGNTILSLFKKTNIDLNIITPQSWAVLSNSTKVPTDIWKEALSPVRTNPDEIFADIYALSSPKNKSELVKYAFSDFNFKFTPAVAVTLLESAETVETAKMIFDRSSIEKWDPGDSDLSAFFNGSIRYRNSGVQNYAYSVISKMFERMGRKEAVSFFSGIYDPKSVLFYVIKKRNLSLDDVNILYNKMARILSTRDDDDADPRYSNALDSLFKTILRYHSDKPELTAQFISNVANSDSYYSMLNYFKTIVKHFNGNIPYEIFKEMHRVMIDGVSKYGSVRSFTDTIIILTNLILKTNPSAVYIDNTVTYIMDMLKSIGNNHYGYEDKVLKEVEEI